MTTKELNRRLTTMTETQFCAARALVLQGWGASGLVNDTTLTLKQANAVFEWVHRNGKTALPTCFAI